MKQRFPRRARPLVAAAAILFAVFGVSAAAHVAKRGPDLYARLAVIQVMHAQDNKEMRDDAIAFLRKFGPRGLHAMTSRAREGPIPDELFEVIAQFAGDEEIDILVGSVREQEEGRRTVAVRALGRIHSEAAARAAGIALSDSAADVRSAAREALRGHSEDVLRAAVTEAMGSSSFQAEFVSAMLVEEGVVAAAVRPVAEGLRSQDLNRAYNALHLAQVIFPRFPPGPGREAELANGITAALWRFEPGPQCVSVEVLASLSGPEALSGLCAVATQNRLAAPARLKAIAALAGRRDPRAVAALEKVIANVRQDLRFAAADALGSTGTDEDAKRWLDSIERGAVDRDTGNALLRAVAAAGSAALIPRLFVSINVAGTRSLHETVHAIVARDVAKGLPLLIDELAQVPPVTIGWLDQELRGFTAHESRPAGQWRTTEEYELEREAVRKDWLVWWNLNKSKTPDEWREAGKREAEHDLRSASASDRARAVARLVLMAPPDLDSLLVSLLGDPEDLVWKRVQDALGSTGTPDGNDILRGKLKTGSPREQGRAARLLGLRLDRNALEALQYLTKSPDATVRREAAAALGSIGDPVASRSLLPLLRDASETVRFIARGSLETLADRGIEADLLEGLRSGDAEYQVSCLVLLGRCGTRRAVRPLIKHFHDPDERAQQAAVGSYQMLSGTMPSTLDPGETEIRNWEDLVERRQR